MQEEGDQLFGENPSCNSSDQQNDAGKLDAEPEPFLNTFKQLGTIVKSTYWLEALSKADDDGSGKL